MGMIAVNGKTYAVEGLLFDKDGTILDFVSMWGPWCEWLLQGYIGRLERLAPGSVSSLGLTPAFLPRLLGTVHQADGRIVDYDRNGPLAMGTLPELFGILSWHAYQAGLSWAEAKELVEACRQEAESQLAKAKPIKALPGLLPLLEAAKAAGIPMAVVTADDTEPAERHLAWMGIRHYFETVVGNDLAERGKPFPDLMELACRRLGVGCGSVAMIGDTNADMRMGRAAGAAVTIGIAPTDEAGVSDVTAGLTDADHVIAGYAEISIRGASDES
ncbi:HAD family hydrolase [Paenibacillus methanolicus]|uniref:Phosphoglycolate phosphatase n=1 Tax=Paenibacillus methanolicus TaxID=582686 RepID=A0A5S5CH76_9BACL|nr:HAD family hydrolase [Paenibacillus methanolicus]TYP78894.1 phosphoglycolate phosphatase [Paenibacillus methanolicus]